MSAHTGIPVEDTATPCLVIDIDLLDRNISSMADHVRSCGKSLRPHAKSHKCSVLAKKQAASGAIGISAATVPEVEGLVGAGIHGVLLTSPVVSSPAIARLMAARERDSTLTAVVDNPEHATVLDRAARERGIELDVLLDLDVGQHRTGVSPENAAEAALFISGLPNLRFRGIQAYAGHVQHIAGWEERRKASLACMEKAADAVHRIRSAGIPCEIVSGAGTGTHDIDTSLEELSELQAGSYVLMDAEYLAIGSAGSAGFTPFVPALSLHSTVLSVRDGFATIDAGLKALYRDGATPLVLSPSTPGIIYDWSGDEFGRISTPSDFSARPGDRIRLVVSHCDPTVALFDRFYIAKNDIVTDVWEIDLRRG